MIKAITGKRKTCQGSMSEVGELHKKVDQNSVICFYCKRTLKIWNKGVYYSFVPRHKAQVK